MGTSQGQYLPAWGEFALRDATPGSPLSTRTRSGRVQGRGRGVIRLLEADLNKHHGLFFVSEYKIQTRWQEKLPGLKKPG